MKQGQGGFALLLQKRPEVYADWEWNEEQLRLHLGKPISILRDRRGGQTRPMTLREFRGRFACGDYDKQEFGGCGCFIDDE